MTRSTNFWVNLDWISILIYLILMTIGVLSIFSAVYDESHSRIFDTSQRYGKQILWVSAAIVLAAAVLITDHKFFPFFAYLFYAITIFLLIGVLIFGTEVNASKSWFQFGSVQIQPAEFAKLATALAIAKYLGSTKQKIHSTDSLLIIGGVLLLPVMLILLQPDVGSSLVFAAFVFALYREGLSGYFLLFLFTTILLSILALLSAEITMLIGIVAFSLLLFQFTGKKFGIRIKYVLLFLLINSAVSVLIIVIWPALSLYISLATGSLIASVTLFIVTGIKRVNNGPVLMAFLAISILYTHTVDFAFENLLMPHHKSRINIILGYEDDPLGQSYNINQSKIAIGSGGLYGKGFLQGTQTKFNFVPEQSTDFIFCTIGEEGGFIGSAFLLLLFLTLLLRLIYIAERQRSRFARFYGYSLISILFFHFVINIGMTIGMVPVIGIPLPFVSYGGSSIWSFTIMLFIFLKLDASRMDLLV